MQPTRMDSLTYAENQYRHIQRHTASPRQTIFNVYSEAISACHKQDSLLAIRALAALQLSLNPNNPSALNEQLNSIYEHCLLKVQVLDFITVIDILIELRSLLAS